MKRTKKLLGRLSVVLAALVIVAAAGIPGMDAQAAKKPKSIKLKTTAKTIDVKGQAVVSVKSVKPSGASKSVSFKSSDKKIAKVDAKGVVTGVKKGKATITATSKVNKKVKAKIKITVVKEFKGAYVISVSELKKKISKKEKMVLVDTRGIDAKTETAKNAITMKWQDISNVSVGSGNAGFARTLPAASVSKKLGALGLGKSDQIILFSDGYTSGGWGDDGRVAWQLFQCGYKNVKMVNGGLSAMKRAGIATQKGPSKAKKKTVKVAKVDTASHDITTETLKKDYSQYKIVDVRTDKEYKGAVLYGEKSGGHLKGAVHIRFTDLFRSGGTLKDNAALTKMFEKAGLHKDDKIVTYCTGGIRSGYMQLVLEMCGFKHTYNYAESVYRWSNTKDAGTGSLWEK